MQSMMLGLFNLKTYISNMNAQITLLKGNVNNFNRLLDVMEHGGTMDSEVGYGGLRYRAVITRPLSNTAHGRNQIGALRQQWKNYEQETSAYLQTGGSDAQQLNFALESGIQSYSAMYLNLNEITEQALQKSERWNSILKYIQLIGIMILVAYFIVFIFYFIRQLIQADDQAKMAEQGNHDIMRTVDIGLFLLDREMNIGHQYSAKLENIIGRRQLQGLNFVDLLVDMISAERVAATRVFVEQLYSEWVIEQLLGSLNPLKKISAKVSDLNGNKVHKVLSFRFSRVMRDEQIFQILVNVADITEAVEMEKELQAEQAHSERHLGMISTILNTDVGLIADFAHSASTKLDMINATLKSPERSAEALQEKVRLIYREAHSLKGEASALGLHSFVAVVSELESNVKLLSNKHQLGGNDFLGLAMELEQLMELSQVIRQLSQKIVGAQSLPSPDNTALNERYYRAFAEKIAERNGKSVTVNWEDNGVTVPAPLQESLREIVIQLIRNAIVHGIETADVRRSRRKFEAGNIEISLQQAAQHLQLTVKDDGHGLDYEAIKQKAIAHQVVTAAEVQTWDKAKITALIFHPGLSTAQHAAEDAGEGRGMDIVKDRVNRLRGKLKVRSAEQQFTQFTVLIPQDAWL
ncbi:MAG: ATP-binding protein [Neisseria sp.]|nr:ATP-binding protein [Neisseria sp.]